ncbi:peroxide stress protein YaaA [Zeaxanthinibacter sp. PT1]|uniref:peroxide stress protein YaaA n=1 Tax=Zeaxanthinibacter TaxID=561554 RepID=UPI00234918A2|nr:peroxide stress protein YaaA [Zeaxanthinibacter sp. PT1]MDC6351824.1 peroxide stress protein YaaA [Zeaxanthinibacter sp. PT1]
MKIVISPAKSMDYERELPIQTHTQARFLQEAERLNKILAKKSPKSLSKLMDISADLADLNWQRNQDFRLPFSTDNARPAVFAFDGDVYQGLDAYTLDEGKLERLQGSLRILSGLYGILKPLDLIQPYRLEMGTSLKVGRKKNLYEFWKENITQALNDELEEGELFVNLASNEYFNAVGAKKLKTPVITPVFKDWKNDNLKVISFFAKKARGAMVRYIVDKDARTLDDLKGFDYLDYCYSKEHTLKENNPVFVR